MKTAIMQPYFFPYIGYFQLIGSVDTFVVYDDVNYINGGWINRNFILSQGSPQRFTLALNGASQNRRINQIEVSSNNNKLLKTIAFAYSKAPYFSLIFPLFVEILNFQDRNLGNYLYNSLQKLCTALGLNTRLVLSSSLSKNNNLKGVEKIVSICVQLNTSRYINAIGGRSLYEQDYFDEKEIELSFVSSRPFHYRQYGQHFVSNLSIIDVLMFNSRTQISEFLLSYDLI